MNQTKRISSIPASWEMPHDASREALVKRAYAIVVGPDNKELPTYEMLRAVLSVNQDLGRGIQQALDELLAYRRETQNSYRRGESDGMSRARCRPGDGDMGG